MNNSSILYRPVTLQCSYSSLEDHADFINLVKHLSALGFYGIELNLPTPSSALIDDVKNILRTYDMKMTYVATGGYASKNKLSLSSSDLSIRKKSIDGCIENIKIASEFEAGIIIGYLKNNSLSDNSEPYKYFEDSIQTVLEHTGSFNVPILVEATNHYEASIFNTIDQVYNLIDSLNKPNLYALPDTYHMNIEENKPIYSVDIINDKTPNIHLSDNNRFLPGFGHLQFELFLRHLKESGYNGYFGLEGKYLKSILSDAEASAEFLKSLNI